MDRVRIRSFQDPVALDRAAADLFVDAAAEAVAVGRRFCVALSGGSTPRRLFERLAARECLERVDWSQVEFFWGDERAVPPDHPDSNQRMARLALLDSLPIDAAQIHPIDAGRADLDATALDYQREIARVLSVSPEGSPPSLDLVLLGLGADGHTASLFPHTDALEETQRWVVANPVPKLDTFRITMTAPLINRARRIAFLVVGHDKAAAVASVVDGAADASQLPAQSIRPIAGELQWLVDAAAASELDPALIEVSR